MDYSNDPQGYWLEQAAKAREATAVSNRIAELERRVAELERRLLIPDQKRGNPYDLNRKR